MDQVDSVVASSDLRSAKRIRLLAIDEQDLTCGVCLDILEPDVIVCTNGHATCTSCVRPDASCSVCRGRMLETKSLFHRKLLAPIQVTCRFCKKHVRNDELRGHERTCPLSVEKVCPFCPSDRSTNLKDLPAHLWEWHRERYGTQIPMPITFDGEDAWMLQERWWRTADGTCILALSTSSNVADNDLVFRPLLFSVGAPKVFRLKLRLEGSVEPMGPVVACLESSVEIQMELPSWSASSTRWDGLISESPEALSLRMGTLARVGAKFRRHRATSIVALVSVQ